MYSTANVSISGVTIRDGLGPVNGHGGGIVNLGQLTLSNCVITANGMTPRPAAANGVSTGSNGGNGIAGRHGGGIYNTGTLELYECEISYNGSGQGGDGGNGANGAVGNSPGGHGGHGGNGGYGGGIYSSGTLLLSDCYVWRNSANKGGDGGDGGDGVGAVNAHAGNGGNAGDTGWGAAIYSTGPVTVSRCFFDGNVPVYRANRGTAGSVGLSGNVGSNGTAGDYGRGGAVGGKDATLWVETSTFYGNGGSSYTSRGGAVYWQNGSLVINESTLTQNFVADDGGGIYKTGSAIRMTNSIVCLNSAAANANVYITIQGTNNLVDTDPMLLPLGDYGGPTYTLPPMLDSPAFNAGNLSTTNVAGIDQRGFSRVVGGAPDIGAVELKNPVAAIFVETLSATNIEPVRATLLGEFNPQSGDSWIGFEWGATTNYGTEALIYSQNTTLLPHSYLLQNLTPGETIHYRSVLRNPQGDFHGADMQFTPPTTFEVATLSDYGAGSLRTALAEAHDGNTILILTNGTINVGSQLTINDDLTIVGPGPGQLILNGGNSGRIFNIISGNSVSISGLKIFDGRATSSGDLNGGGIKNLGSLVLSNCVVEFNNAYDGADGQDGTEAGESGDYGESGGNGGGIYNQGTLTLIDCSVRNNYSGSGGEGGNGADGATGSPNGGYGRPGGSGGSGGGIYHALGMLSLVNCKFHYNRSGYGGFGGSGGDGGGLGGDGRNGGDGGSAGHGGGLYLSAGIAVIDQCDFYANGIRDSGSGRRGGNGQFGFNTDAGDGGDGGDAGKGGGVYVQYTQVGITNSTFRNNYANDDGGYFGNGGTPGGTGSSGIPGTHGSKAFGGGLYGYSGYTRTIWNSTFTGNYSTGSGGAGIFASSLVLVNTTVVGNGTGGGINTSSLTLTNSVVANNSGYDVLGGATTFATASLIGTDPMLSPLDDYGGPTLTMPPTPGSPVINAGLSSVTNSLPTDQRGYARRSGTSVDIGAAEYQEADPTNPPVLGQSSFSNFGFTSGPAIYYSVLASGDLTLPLASWTNLGYAVETSPGIYEFEDTLPALSNRFYRVVFP